MADQYNPIHDVDGIEIPCPATYEYRLSDVSDADAGRTENGKMHKMRITQKVQLSLSWKFITTSEVSTILQAFDPEYINITYLDAKEGAYTTRRFYVGDRSAPSYSTYRDLWTNVTFNVIEQ